MDTVGIVLWTITATSAAWALFLAYNVHKSLSCLVVKLSELQEDYYEHNHD